MSGEITCPKGYGKVVFVTTGTRGWCPASGELSCVRCLKSTLPLKAEYRKQFAKRSKKS